MPPQSNEEPGINLSQIHVPGPEQLAATQDDEEARKEQRQFEVAQRKIILDHSRLGLTSLQNNIAARRRFAWAIFWITALWLLAVIVAVFLTGFGKMKLESSVLIALIVSGSANVIGLFTHVAKYLYHSPEHAPPIKALPAKEPPGTGSKDKTSEE